MAWKRRKIRKHGLLDRKARNAATEKLLQELEIEIDAQKKVRNLSVANMQLVELARAVSYDSDIIIMDEPTSALTNREIDILYRIVRKLAKNGTGIIFISHKLEEIYD
ncbi:MAG: ATP-binding cassette domain-containing protein, partial [Blautia sp.]